jgi:hypothetical protein
MPKIPTEKKREYMNTYFNNHRDKWNEYQKDYKSENKEKFNDLRMEYYYYKKSINYDCEVKRLMSIRI